MLKSIKEVNIEDQTKDFRKLGKLVSMAKGYRTINGFAADCKTNPDYIADIINLKISSYPTIKFLEIIADNSEGRVSLKDLKTACGYSLYLNNDMEQIKNIHVRRGWFCYADYGDKAIDSEIGGPRTVLVIQNDKGNIFSSNTIIVPLTSRKFKKNLPTHVLAGTECGLRHDSIISCELVDTVSKRRLLFRGGIQKVAECPEELMKRVEIALAKAQGIIDLDVNEEEAIEVLSNLNNKKQHKFVNNYNENYNFGARPQVAFA